MIIFNKKEEGVKVDLQNMRKQGANLEKLIFNFVDSLVKMIYARRQKTDGQTLIALNIDSWIVFRSWFWIVY